MASCLGFFLAVGDFFRGGKFGAAGGEKGATEEISERVLEIKEQARNGGLCRRHFFFFSLCWCEGFSGTDSVHHLLHLVSAHHCLFLCMNVEPSGLVFIDLWFNCGFVVIVESFSFPWLY